MSSYENYEQTSKNYDKTREPIGTEIIIGCMATGHAPLPEMTLLDAGCGTGNYSVALLPHVKKIEAVDMNEGMIKVASRKFSGGNIAFHNAPINDLPFEDSAFDGVMVNQVLHHLPENGNDLPAHRGAVAEFARVLKPGGVLTINTCSYEQIKNGYWYYSLIPTAARSLRRRYAPLEKLVGIFEEFGLEYRGRFAPTDATVQGEAYFDARGPLDKEWRDGDSAWSLLSEEDLEYTLSEVEDMERRGELEEYVARNDSRRKDIGQLTILSAVKP